MLILQTKADFDTLLKEAGDALVVIDFYATWCGPCKMISPKVEAMSKEFTGVKFAKVDVDENDETAEHCGISAMPTFLFYKNGKKIADVTGANEGKLRDTIEANK